MHNELLQDFFRAIGLFWLEFCQLVNCVVTAGPTYEPLDGARRLTNFSTGQLGIDLANFLSALGHEVTLLVGQQSSYPGEQRARTSGTRSPPRTNLRLKLEAMPVENSSDARVSRGGGEWTLFPESLVAIALHRRS